MASLRLLMTALVLMLALAACGGQGADAPAAAAPAPTGAPAPTEAPRITPETVAVEVVEALVADDAVALQRLVAAEMPMRDIEIPDMVNQWAKATVRNGLCGGPVTEVKAVETRQQGESLVVRVLTRCEKDGPSSLGRGGVDLTMISAGDGYQVLDWSMVDGIVLRDEYADF